MTGHDANLPKRSSSPLKRRASNMERGNVLSVSSPENSNLDSDSLPAPALPSNSSVSVTVIKVDSASSRAMSADLSDACMEKAYQGNRAVNECENMTSLILETGSISMGEQLSRIRELVRSFAEAPIQEGDLAYIVSRTWVDRALALSGDPKFAKKEIIPGPLGPVDNGDIIWQVITEGSNQEEQIIFVRLKPGTDTKDFELFPELAWRLLVEWYGTKDNQPPIIRTAVNASEDGSSILYEFHPLVFRIHRAWAEDNPVAVDVSSGNPPLFLARSRKTLFQDLLRSIKNRLRIPLSRRVRLWSVSGDPHSSLPQSPHPMLSTPPDSPHRPEAGLGATRNPWSDLLVDAATMFALQRSTQRILIPAKDETGNVHYNGKSALDVHALTEDTILVVDEETDRNVFVLRPTPTSVVLDKAPATSYGSATNPASKSLASTSGRSSPASLTGPTTRGRTQQKRSDRHLGVVGFQNLGNTCYMNSALQCIRSVEELTKYFLTGKYKQDVNEGNPLGYNGQVAHAYGKMLKEIYQEPKSSYVPRNFKTTVGRWRPAFAGWAQQDSQEFLGFILDALQEDLSRVKNKPYIPKPDCTDDMINNQTAIVEMANQVWDITKRRDDSVIGDLFTGMYKSTLKCPICAKISITFDPFTNLTLPLPVENVWSKTVKFFPLNDVPVDMEVELPNHSAVELLRQFVSVRTGVPVDCLVGAEEYKGKFFKIYEDSGDVSEEIGNGDIPVVHELESAPTNWPLSRQQQYGKRVRSMVDVDEDYSLLVPVVHRRRSQSDRHTNSAHLPPHFIVANAQEARSEDVIRRKVLEKVATFTTWTGFSDDADPVILPSHTDLTADSGHNTIVADKVITSPVACGGNSVDVSMEDAEPSTEIPSSSGLQSTILQRFLTKRPSFIDPGEFLPAHLQNLFQLCYFSDNTKSVVPTGWQILDDTRAFPTLSSRAPPPSVDQHDDLRSGESSPTGTATDEGDSSEELVGAGAAATRMADDEASDEDEFGNPALKPPNNRSAEPRGNQKLGGKKNLKQYNARVRKGNKRWNPAAKSGKQPQAFQAADVRPQVIPHDGGPLIRLGEGIIVDWNEEAWDEVFGASLNDYSISPRIPGAPAMRTFLKLRRLLDHGLDQRRKARASRRIQGITLDECLDEFEKAEVLSEQDMWFCPRCKEHRRASKKFDLWKTPDVLVAHLKRFSNAGFRREKLDVFVDFPVKTLDLTKRVINQEVGKLEVFDLIGVDNHYGGLGGGHYTAYARNFIDGEWHLYNDSMVTPVPDADAVVTSGAYLLFYRRRSNSALGGTQFGPILERYDSGLDDDEATESGEDQRLVVGSSLLGSSTVGTGVGAVRNRANLGPVSDRSGSGFARTVATSARIVDYDDDDEALPAYTAESGGLAHPSVRSRAKKRSQVDDEGVVLGDIGERESGRGGNAASKQAIYNEWNWDPFDRAGTAEVDYPSDQVEIASSGDDLDLAVRKVLTRTKHEEYDHDYGINIMAGGSGMGTGQSLRPGAPESHLPNRKSADSSYGEPELSVSHSKLHVLTVIPVPDDGYVDEVAEIHLEGGEKVSS